MKKRKNTRYTVKLGSSGVLLPPPQTLSVFIRESGREGLASVYRRIVSAAVMQRKERQCNLCTHWTILHEHTHTQTPEESIPTSLEPGPRGQQLCQFPMGPKSLSPRHDVARGKNTHSFPTSLIHSGLPLRPTLNPATKKTLLCKSSLQFFIFSSHIVCHCEDTAYIV